MRLYESVFIARQDISTSQVDGLCEEFTEIITSGGGKILKKEYWGLKSLAYRIKKNRKGHYVMFNIEADADTMSEYDRKLRLNEDVIRILTIRIDDVDDEPSIMMNNQGDEKPRMASAHNDETSHDDAPSVDESAQNAESPTNNDDAKTVDEEN